MTEYERTLEQSPSWQERLRFGRNLSNSRGDMVFIGNVPDALPPFARAALASHTVPPSVYEGRTPAIAASYALQNPPLVIMQDCPFQIEMQLLDELCKEAKLVTPDVKVTNEPFAYNQLAIEEVVHLYSGYSFQPFIGTEHFPGGTPRAALFNNKAFMRSLMKLHGMDINLAQGVEIFLHKNDDLSSFISKIEDALDSSTLETVRLKLAESASGLGSFKVSIHDFKSQNQYREEIHRLLLDTFVQKNELYLGDIVIEEQINFGNGEYDDYGVRGYITPTGEFFFLSIGREITDEQGTHVGMGMGSLENPSAIGLTSAILSDVKSTTKQLSQILFKEGYWGPVNLDIFVDKQGKAPHLIHDFNMRDGDSTAAGAFVPILYSSNPGFALDVRLLTKDKLNEKQVDHMATKLWEERIFPYSTTFLRYPQAEGEQLIYTMKIIAPSYGAITKKSEELERLNTLENALNSLGVDKFKINF